MNHYTWPLYKQIDDVIQNFASAVTNSLNAALCVRLQNVFTQPLIGEKNHLCRLRDHTLRTALKRIINELNGQIPAEIKAYR